MIPEIVAEVDRQLTEQRAIAESLATRSGLLIAASAAILGFAAAGTAPHQSAVAYWSIGGAMVLGAIIFWMARLGNGPTLSAHMNDARQLRTSKLILVDANKTVLIRVQVVFTVQVLLTIAGIAKLALELWPLP